MTENENGSPTSNTNVDFWIQFLRDHAIKRMNVVAEWVQELWESDREFFVLALEMRSLYNDFIATGIRKRKAFYLAAEEIAERMRRVEKEEREIEIIEKGGKDE